MIIARDIPGIYASFKEGLEFNNLMIGGTKNAPNRVKIEGAISLDKADADMLDELSAAGVEVIFQQTAQTRITPWADVRKKHSFE
ncbi:MAG: PTS sugar transporter subunit IIB [Firmicutes bacterium]|nr:PTS sugar transporter subunit IIB [Bacillota bacterium]